MWAEDSGDLWIQDSTSLATPLWFSVEGIEDLSILGRNGKELVLALLA